MTPPTAQNTTSNPQPVQVIVNNYMPSSAMTTGTAPSGAIASAQDQRVEEEPEETFVVRSMNEVLSRRDHGIYVTLDSTFVVEHPHADRLLDGLDFVIYQSMFKDGDPYKVPALDDTAEVEPLPLLPAWDDGGFNNVPLQVIPEPDGQLWVAQVAAPPRPLLKMMASGELGGGFV